MSRQGVFGLQVQVGTGSTVLLQKPNPIQQCRKVNESQRRREAHQGKKVKGKKLKERREVPHPIGEESRKERSAEDQRSQHRDLFTQGECVSSRKQQNKQKKNRLFFQALHCTARFHCTAFHFHFHFFALLYSSHKIFGDSTRNTTYTHTHTHTLPQKKEKP